MAYTELKSADKQALKTYINANYAALVTQQDYSAIADALNLASSGPAVNGWMTSVGAQVIDEASNWTAFDTMSAGKRDSWKMFFAFSRDFSRGKVRSWVTDIWGAATAGSNAESILLATVEPATVAEVVVGGATRATGTVSALDRKWIGRISVYDIGGILAS